MPDITPLRLVVSTQAQAEFAAAADWLRDSPFGGEDSARRLLETLKQVLPTLCADVAERMATRSNHGHTLATLPRPDEDASIALSRPAYRFTFTTAKSGKRRRRQTSGVWSVIYDFPDTKTLRVLMLRHGAAQPLTAWLDDLEDA